MPKISIIVPVYKVEKYLHRCLDSIIAQTFTDWECILIDDGSPDGSGKICDEYAQKDGRFRVFHQENQGVSAARNKGLDEARGEYVNFIDSDDWIDSKLLELLYNSVNDYEIVFFGNYNCYKDGNMVAHIPREAICLSKKDTEQEIFHLKFNDESFEYFGYTWNKMFRLSIIKDYSVKFINGLNLREDELFTMSYCQHISTLKVISESLYYYRYCLGLSITRKQPKVITNYAYHLAEMANNWTIEQLKALDMFRYSQFIFFASCAENNFFRRASMSIKAYRTKRKYYVEEFSILHHGPFRFNILVGTAYSLFGKILGKH